MIKKDFKMCPVTKFIVWLILGLLVCIIGISNVFADTYTAEQYTPQLYDNYGPTLSAVTTDYTNGRWQGEIPTMTANSSGAAWGISSPVVLLANHTYSVSIKITGPYGGSIVLSTYNRVGVGTTLANAQTSYQNNTNATENYSRVVDGNTIQYAFTPTINASYFIIPFSTNLTGNYYVFWLNNGVVIDDLGSSGGVSESTINNSLNSQTNVLNQSITNSQNAIIQNQNDNNQALIESNQELLGNCIKNFMTSNSIVSLDNLWQQGNNFQQQTADTATQLNLITQAYNNGTYQYNIGNPITISSTGRYKIGFTKRSDYNQVKFKINGIQRDTGLIIDVSNLENDTIYYISADFYNLTQGNIQFKELMITDINTNTFVKWGDTFCTSKLDDTNDAINGLNDTMNDDNVDSSSWSNFFNNFTTNTFGLTSIITAPLNLIQSLTSTSCTDLQLPLPYLQNKYLTLPCMTTIYSQYFGTFFTLYQTITYGIIAYWVCVRIFNLVKDFKNPNHDEIEVVDL